MPEVDDTQKQLMALIAEYAVDVNTTITEYAQSDMDIGTADAALEHVTRWYQFRCEARGIAFRTFASTYARILEQQLAALPKTTLSS